MPDTDLSAPSSPTPTETPMNVGSQLCTQCGLCCTGAIHDFVRLDEQEAGDAQELGLELLKSDNSRFALPCRRLCGSRCSIYERRPRACIRYRCRLLQSVESGETSMEHACKTVETQRALIEKVQALMPVGSSFPEARELAQRATQDDSPNPELLLRTIAAMHFIDKNFRNEKEGPLLWEE